jgi:hypothetical protein
MCCSLIKSNDLIFGLKNFFRYYFISNETIEGKNNMVGIHENYPDYLNFILKNIDEVTYDILEKEFSHLIENFNAVMVFDCRTKKMIKSPISISFVCNYCLAVTSTPFSLYLTSMNIANVLSM